MVAPSRPSHGSSAAPASSSACHVSPAPLRRSRLMRPALFVQRPDAASRPRWTSAFVQNDHVAGSRYVVGNSPAPASGANASPHQAAGPILIVEDDIAVQTMLSMALEDADYPVTVARNGLEALKQLDVVRPRLILLDMRMPVMDGPTFLRELYNRPNHPIPPVIIMTAYREIDPAALVFGLPAISKPMNIELLLRLIEQQTTTE
ncbi:MAG: hypothetical protein CYG59_13415 [Chloroflexi bacterium]|nr:MAG: hypothetical protein CYG59_13415 [Chloroflexota bacterium]